MYEAHNNVMIVARSILLALYPMLKNIGTCEYEARSFHKSCLS